MFSVGLLSLVQSCETGMGGLTAPFIVSLTYSEQEWETRLDDDNKDKPGRNVDVANFSEYCIVFRVW